METFLPWQCTSVCKGGSAAANAGRRNAGLRALERLAAHVWTSKSGCTITAVPEKKRLPQKLVGKQRKERTLSRREKTKRHSHVSALIHRPRAPSQQDRTARTRSATHGCQQKEGTYVESKQGKASQKGLVPLPLLVALVDSTALNNGFEDVRSERATTDAIGVTRPSCHSKNGVADGEER